MEILRHNPVSRRFAPAKLVSRALIKQRQERQAWQKIERAARGFKPRKKDLGQVVFLAAAPRGPKAERLGPDSRRQAVPFYVVSKGKRKGWLVPVREYKHRAQPVQAVKPSQFDPVGLRAGKRTPKRAERRLRAYYVPVQELRTVDQAGKKQGKSWRKAFWNELQTIPRRAGQVEWPEVVEAGARAMTTAFAGELAKERQLYLHFRLAVETADGRAQVWDERLPFRQSQYQELVNTGWYEKFIETKCYAFFAEYLKNHGLVPLGSYNVIRGLAANRGKPRSEWVDRKGFKWKEGKGASLQPVIIHDAWLLVERMEVK